MEELLKKLGFINIAGTLWKHKDAGSIQIKETDNIADLVKIIHRQGYRKCQTDIKELLNIN